MLIVPNTPENRTVQQAVASMAVEGMYFDREFLSEILKVANGEKTSEELRKEIIKKYTQQNNLTV